jgi:UDPglucose--hexose-1-phosphate uridylyltransferase
MHNAPVNLENADQFHFHLEIYPPYRAPGRVKYLAGVELGCNTFINSNSPQEQVDLLRQQEVE